MKVGAKYLELGLVALGRSGETGDWFSGHYGAALLAAYYMDKEFDLPEHVQNGLIRTCENFISKLPHLFVPYEAEQADPELINKVVEGLEANAKQLSHSGHGLAYGFLGLKALKERPDLCIPSIVNGFYETLIQATKANVDRYWGIPNYFELDPAEVEVIPEYRNLDDMMERALAECHRICPTQTLNGKRYHFTGEIEHGLTHGQALVEFTKLGYPHLTEMGLPNHRLQMRLNRQVPDEVLHTEIKEPPYASLFAPEHWEKTFNDPHATKVPYAALFMLQSLPEDQRAEAERNVCKIICQFK